MKKIAIALLALTLTATGTSAIAAPKKCTSSQTSSIRSQQSSVDSAQRTVSQDQATYNKDQMALNTANSKVAELSTKIAASQKKISDLLASAAKNIVKSPSIARGYQSQADSETRSLNGVQMTYKSAVSDAANKAKTANSSLAKLSSSQKALESQRQRLQSLMSQCNA